MSDDKIEYKIERNCHGQFSVLYACPDCGDWEVLQRQYYKSFEDGVWCTEAEAETAMKWYAKEYRRVQKLNETTVVKKGVL